MTDSDNDERFARKAKSLFDDSVERIDAATLSRLTQSRYKALEQLERSSGRAPRAFWVPATGLAAALLVAVLILRMPADTIEPLDQPLAQDFDILLEEDSLEMFEELEFYSWLELADAQPDDNVG